MVLEGHVLDFQGTELAVLLAMRQHGTGGHGVNVDLYDGPSAEGHDGIANAGEPFDQVLHPERIQVALAVEQLQEKFRAVAEFHGAVFAKISLNFRRFRHSVDFRSLGNGSAPADGVGPPDDVIKPGSAAVNDPGLFQHGQQFRRMP